MPNMTEKARVGLLIAFAIAATAWTSDARLAINPSSKHLSVPAGKPFEITCTQGEFGDDRYFSDMRWINPKGVALPEGNSGAQKVGTNSLKLAFNAPKTSDSGVYRCVALHDKEQSLQTEVTIIFFSGREPAFERDFEDEVAIEGSKLAILCMATGESPLEYKWYNEKEEPIPFNQNSIFVSSSGKGSTLNIKAAKATDSGVYRCSVNNSIGLASKLFNITVFPISEEDTSSIRNVQALKITENSIVFRIATSGSVHSIEVKYTEKQNSTEYQAKWENGDNYEIKDLIPSGLYKFQFRTIPSNGIWSKVYEMTLLPDVPEVILRSLEGNSIRLEWFRTLDNILRGTVDKYTLTYYTVQINRGTDWIPSTCAVTIELPSCVGSSHTISGLSSRIYYQIEFRAHTASGFGGPYKQKFYLQ